MNEQEYKPIIETSVSYTHLDVYKRQHKEAQKEVMRMFNEDHMRELYHQMELESQMLIN